MKPGGAGASRVDSTRGESYIVRLIDRRWPCHQHAHRHGANDERQASIALAALHEDDSAATPTAPRSLRPLPGVLVLDRWTVCFRPSPFVGSKIPAPAASCPAPFRKRLKAPKASFPPECRGRSAVPQWSAWLHARNDRAGRPSSCSVPLGFGLPTKMQARPRKCPPANTFLHSPPPPMDGCSLRRAVPDRDRGRI